jgi:hypothetical protein
MRKINLSVAKIIFLLISLGVIGGFWFFEESNLLKIIVIPVTVFAVIISMLNKKADYAFKRSELAAYLIVFLGFLILFNLLYSINLPVAFIMMLAFLLTFISFVFILFDNQNSFFEKENFYLFAIISGIVSLEIFLTLFFWPVAPEIKSLIMITSFYLTSNIIYLYANSVLHLKKAIGFVIISFVIVTIILLTTWLKLPR